MDELRQFYQKHEIKLSIAFFFLGVLVDIFTLGGIDDWLNIVQLSLYLAVLLFFIITEARLKNGNYQLPERFQRAWTYHELLSHFLYGSLLSAYTLFFVKSASFAASSSFLLLMGTLLVLNEFPRFQAMGLTARSLLWSLCFIGHLSCLFPIMLGFIGWVPFLLAQISTGLMLWALVHYLKSKTADVLWRDQILRPMALIQGLFFLMYLFHVIPPVPLALNQIGIYHQVEKKDGHYIGRYRRDSWRIWEKGAQTFQWREGEKINLLFSVIAPARFDDQLRVRWRWKNPTSGWTRADSIPVPIKGGREQGFRGFASKQYLQAGDWMVHVETTDGREVGRLSFTVITDATADASQAMQEDYF